MRLAAISILFCACCFGQTQLSNTNRVLHVTTSSNLTSISNAVRVASGLHVGMAGADVQKYMREHGMVQTNVYSISADRGRTLSWAYPLAGSATLMLDMHCTQAPKSALFDWSAPVLDRARIQSQAADVMTITLTNAP